MLGEFIVRSIFSATSIQNWLKFGFKLTALVSIGLMLAGTISRLQFCLIPSRFH